MTKTPFKIQPVGKETWTSSMRFSILLVAVMSASLCFGQKSSSASASEPNLQLSVRTNRTVYSMKDKLHIEVQLTNAGNSDVYVWDWFFCWGQGSDLSIHAFDANGKMVQPVSGILIDCVPPPPKEHDTSQFIRLEPGRFYGVSAEALSWP